MAARDHRGMYPDRDAAVAPFADGEQLDHPAERPRAEDIGGGDLGDALAVHVRRGHRSVEGQAGQDGRLGGRVEPLHVGGRVGLGVAERLGFLQGFGEARARGVHPVEDEVGGAVDDAEHAVHGVAGQRFAQRAQQRDGAGHGGLVVQVGAVLAGCPVDLRAVLGEQGLVRGDHRLAAFQRGEQQRPGRLDATDHLDHDVDIGPGGQRVRVRGEQRAVDPGRPPVPDSPHRDPGQLQPGADTQGEVIGLLGEQPGHLGSHDAASEQSHLEGREGLVHPTSRLSRSSRVSRRTIVRAEPAPTATTAGRET